MENSLELTVMGYIIYTVYGFDFGDKYADSIMSSSYRDLYGDK